MSLRGLDNQRDQPPHGWTNHDRHLWGHPWDDGLEDYLEWRDWREPALTFRKTQVVISSERVGGTTREPCASAADAWPPVPPMPIPPEPSGAPAAQLRTDVNGPVGSHDRAV
jgi:hypothetical protein